MSVPLNCDLHCHSTASDGVLAPAALVRRAAANGVDVLALTDHDATAGLAEARAQSAESGLRLIEGVEISVSWGAISVHVLGLNIDSANGELQQCLHAIRGGRSARARKIADDLAHAGIPGSLEGAYAYVDNPHLIGRTHFARFLVAKRYVKDMRSAFQHYLVAGKPGYVAHRWAGLAQGVSAIKAAGGVAVLAHAGRYRITRTQMRQLLAEFKECGGTGIEVVSSSHNADQTLAYTYLAREFGLLASRGSDFHAVGESRWDLGKLPQVPGELKPVWHDW